MTRQEITQVRCKKFSQWTRKNLPDSKTGFVVFDVDFIFSNYIKKTIMIIEEKTHNGECGFAQKKFLELLNKIFKEGCDKTNYDYKGYYTVVFENECFDDGKCYLIDNQKDNHKKLLIKEKEFIEFVKSKLQ
tara:strand:- start:78 stop:473 length:396 start_codon:yes stop_codon:yes gene_type:complete